MTALTDPRPHVFQEAPIDDDRPHLEAQVAGLLLINLLQDYPDVDLPTVRLWRYSADGVPTMRVDARRGELAGVECPQCHQPAGRPHTEYCPPAIREEAFGQLDGVAQPCCRALFDENHPADALGAHHEPTCSRYLGRRATISQTSQPATRTSQPVTEIRGEAGPELFIEIHGQATPDLVEELRKAIRRAARQDGRSS